MTNVPDNKSKRVIIFKTVVCVFLMLALLLLGGCSASGGKVQKVQQGMTAYLQDRYGIEFDVGEPYVIGSMGTAHYQAKVHPKEHPEIEFLVDDGSSLEEAGSGKYSDYYLTAKWSYQGKLEVEKRLREVYGEGVDFQIHRYELVVANTGYKFKDLDFVQVFEKSHGHGLIHLDYDVFMDNIQLNKNVEAKKAYNIMKSVVLDYGSNNYSFSVTYIDKTYKQDYLANPNYYINDKAYQDKKLLGWLTIVGGIYPPGIDGIKSDSDLVKFYKY